MLKPNHEPNFRKILEPIARVKSSPVSVFSDFVRISACALANQSREEEYHEVITRYSKDEQQALCKAFAQLVQEMQKKPFGDVLGSYYETINSKAAREGRGEFFTPEPISELMAMVTLDVERIISANTAVIVNEPSCGSGGMILQLAKQLSPERTKDEKSYVDLLRVTAQDLSPIACDMTYINTTFWGIPTQVVRGNTLTREIDAVWNNIHWLRVGEDQRQKFIRLKESIGSLFESSQKSEVKPEASECTIGEQMDLEF